MRTLVLLVLASLGCAAKPIELEFPGLEDRVIVELPDNHDRSKKWPAVLYYHGTNGKPTTRFITQHTGRQDWIVVGMAYRHGGQFTLSKEHYADEVQILNSVRQYLSDKHALDPRRVYVAGFSKGGWISELLIQRESSLAGAIILGAGHLHKIRTGTGPFPRRTPIFLGVGREDRNYPFSLRAVVFFRGLGATLTFETWHDRGHNFPTQPSPSLIQWLKIEQAPRADHGEEARAWIEAQLDGIAPMHEATAQWLALRDLEATPYFQAAGKAAKTKVKAAREKLEQVPAVAAEAEALASHRRILRREISSHDRAHYEHVLLDYLKLSESAAGTRQGKIAGKDHRRIETLLKHYDENERLREAEENPFGAPDEKSEAVEPKFPERGRRIPGNPLVK